MVVLEQPGSDSTAGAGHSQTDTMHGDTLMIGTGLNVGPRDYYPSPPSTETESSGSVIPPLMVGGPPLPPVRRSTAHTEHRGPDGVPLTETSGRYPEYKH